MLSADCCRQLPSAIKNPSFRRGFSLPLQELFHNIDAAVDGHHWPAHHDATVIFLVVIVGSALVLVRVAAVLLRLSRRHAAVAPAGLLALAPARRMALKHVIFVAVAHFPAMVVVVVLGGVWIAVFLVVTLAALIGQQCRRARQRKHENECGEPVFAHRYSPG